MGEQHYGRAPCGCFREHPEPFVEGFVPSSSVCRQHGALFVDGVLVAPWHAASAIEHGLRAIAGWPYSTPLPRAVRFGILHDSLTGRNRFAAADGLHVFGVDAPKWEDVAPLLAESLADYTRAIGVPADVAREVLTEVVGHPDEFANCDCPSHAGEDGEVVVRPSARTRCYFCARPVSDGVCTVCGERQPTTEREDT